VASFLTLLAVGRAWAEAFWKTPPVGLSVSIEGRATRPGQLAALFTATATLVVALVGIGILAEPVVAFSLQAGEQLADPGDYIRAVLGADR
jgi:multicomponent Na+:H+ antiporter subunit D